MAGTGVGCWNPEGDRCNYGEEIGLIVQLEIEAGDGRRKASSAMKLESLHRFGPVGGLL